MILIRAFLVLILLATFAHSSHIRVGNIDDEYVTINTYSTTPAPTYPTYISGTVGIDGETVTLDWSEALTQGTGYNDADINLNGSVTGDDVGVTYVSGDTTDTHVYTSDSVFQSGETITLDFNGDADSLEDSNGDDLQAIVDGEVVNDSEQGAVTYLIDQNFETPTTGYDNGETWLDGAASTSILDPANSTSPAPLLGTQSLYLGDETVQATCYAETSFSANGTLNVFYLTHYTDFGTDSNNEIQLKNGSTVVAWVRTLTDGTVRLYHGSSSTGAITTGISLDTTYYVWIEYTKSTGSNDGTLTIYVSPNGTKGAADGTLTTGTQTSDINGFRVQRLYRQDVYYDKILISNETIGDQ